jgi:hypothetical protein
MGASRARHVKGSRRRQGSTCFRSNDGSYSVRAVFGLPPRSDRGSRRADAVAIPTALSAREDLTVIAPFRSKEYRRMLRQQGGIGRYAGLAGSRTERGDQAQIPGSSSRERCSSSEVLPSARAAGQNFFTDRLPSHRATGRSHRVPEATPEPRICTTSSATPRRPVLRVRRDLGGGTNRQEPGDTAASLGASAAAQPERLSSPRKGRPMNLVVRSD